MYVKSLPQHDLQHVHPISASEYQRSALRGSFTALQMSCLQEALRSDFEAALVALKRSTGLASQTKKCSELHKMASLVRYVDLQWAAITYAARAIPVRHMEPRQQCLLPGFDIVAEAPNSANLVRMEFSDALDFVVEESMSSGFGPQDELSIDRHEIDTYYKPVSYTHLRAHETPEHLVCRLLLEKNKQRITTKTTRY
eukprot:TRINITY_DN49567_c0_g1_i1.p1 TRINITY_DN49567_c0_g1~~TRINITY_DN49567_c0_g1_i1.p1  ORF type:complete len:198 (-),score=36.38 TRINITY_DN49567_c0_g1_i1:65-658(-)